MTTTDVPTIRSAADIPGWFFWVDRRLIEAVLDGQADGPRGDLVELGTYQGKSAVVIGAYRRPGERFVALDLFGRTDLLAEGHTSNRREVEKSYATLTRRSFERNYLALHPELPEIVEGPSSVIMDHVAPGSVRFLHVDASHHYDHVRGDADSARRMLRPGGVVVFDDWRSEHTPGVTAAVWEAVFTAGLIPVAVSPTKLYGVFADPEPTRAAIGRLLAADRRIWSEVQQIAGFAVWRTTLRDKPVRTAPTAPSVPPAASPEAIARVVRAELDRRSPLTRVRRWVRARWSA